MIFVFLVKYMQLLTQRTCLLFHVIIFRECDKILIIQRKKNSDVVIITIPVIDTMFALRETNTYENIKALLFYFTTHRAGILKPQYAVPHA